MKFCVDEVTQPVVATSSVHTPALNVATLIAAENPNRIHLIVRMPGGFKLGGSDLTDANGYQGANLSAGAGNEFVLSGSSAGVALYGLRSASGSFNVFEVVVVPS